MSKAHRRFLHHPEHWGVLACKTRADSSVVWLNRTGTFGIASAAYWFSRLIGLVGRLSFRVLLEAFIFVLIYADDLHLIGAGKDRWLNIWMTLALFCMQGAPFSDHKWRGGLQVDWVGYWIDYTRFRLGFLKRDVSGSSQVLLWIRPFLAPGYAWLSAVHRGAVLSLPNLVRCTLLFVVGKLKRGLGPAHLVWSRRTLGRSFARTLPAMMIPLY